MSSESNGEREARINRKIEQEIERKARSRVRTKVGFVWHFAVFVVVNLALLAINQTYSPDYLWFIWPLAGWGVGLLAHAMAVFLFVGATDTMVAQEIEKEKLRRSLISKTD